MARLLEVQAEWCRRLGSPLYGRLLEAAAADCAAGGATWEVLAGHESEPVASALALRLMGAVHRLVLAGEAPALAACYPSAGGTSLADPWVPFHAVLRARPETLRARITEPLQTNEVGRAAVLLGGFLTIARATALPLRLLEIGAGAGLNLRWDHYRYESDLDAFGDPDSPVRFTDVFEGPHPMLAGDAVPIGERAGCDRRPVDPCSPDGQATLRSFIWPDQRQRLARLDGALAVAARVPAVVEQADARDWLPAQLARRVPGHTTVVFHSIVMQYLGREGAARIADVLATAGARATTAAPLAWLRFEPAKSATGDWEYRLESTSWPPGETRLLAVGSPHGPPVRWLGA